MSSSTPKPLIQYGEMQGISCLSSQVVLMLPQTFCSPSRQDIFQFRFVSFYFPNVVLQMDIKKSKVTKIKYIEKLNTYCQNQILCVVIYVSLYSCIYLPSQLNRQLSQFSKHLNGQHFWTQFSKLSGILLVPQEMRYQHFIK